MPTAYPNTSAHRRPRALRRCHAFEETVRDLLAMYDVRPDDLLVARDAHPQYHSSAHALTELRAVQHHRAHVASVLDRTEPGRSGS
jgi:hydrogenase maturation factor HypF (carbamoyltransferase family)